MFHSYGVCMHVWLVECSCVLFALMDRLDSISFRLLCVWSYFLMMSCLICLGLICVDCGLHFPEAWSELILLTSFYVLLICVIYLIFVNLYMIDLDLFDLLKLLVVVDFYSLFLEWNWLYWIHLISWFLFFIMSVLY